MANEATPRINAHYLEQFTNQTVRIVGKIVALHGETATLDASGPINIYLNRESHLTVGNAAEVIGKVQQDLSVKVLQATDFGSNLDYAAANAVVEATHRYKEIFYESAGGD
ncbi:hypothetical protein MMC19_001606 [Ptychographa xylographoides]|nr:hypothetical protein [Ptychographa xylographoides]